MGRQAVFYLCADRDKDPVGPNVLEAIQRLLAPSETGLMVDGRAVLESRDARQNSFLFVPTSEVLSHAYPAYLPIMQAMFSECDFAGLVNWHRGRGDDKPLFTAHSTADVPSGVFGPCAPLYVRNTVLALDRLRREAGLSSYSVQTEGSHWSGAAHDLAPEQLLQYRVPLADIEIGSGPLSWANRDAAEVVARALLEVFTSPCEESLVRNLLCAGGVHLESSYTEAILQTSTEFPLAVSHVLPNAELVRGGYDQPTARSRIENCLSSVEGGVQCIVIHDDVKAPYKAAIRQLGEERQIPIVKHRVLREPARLDLWHT